MSRVRELLQCQGSSQQQLNSPSLGKNYMLPRKAQSAQCTRDTERSADWYVIRNRANNHDRTAVRYGTLNSPVMYSSVQPSGKFPAVLSFGGLDVDNKYEGEGRNAFDRELALERKRHEFAVQTYYQDLYKQRLLRELGEQRTAAHSLSSSAAAAERSAGSTSVSRDTSRPTHRVASASQGSSREGPAAPPRRRWAREQPGSHDVDSNQEGTSATNTQGRRYTQPPTEGLASNPHRASNGGVTSLVLAHIATRAQAPSRPTSAQSRSTTASATRCPLSTVDGGILTPTLAVRALLPYQEF